MGAYDGAFAEAYTNHRTSQTSTKKKDFVILTNRIFLEPICRILALRYRSKIIFSVFVSEILFACCALLATVNWITAGICQYAKQHGFVTADCADKKLTKVPDLKSDVEVCFILFGI